MQSALVHRARLLERVVGTRNAQGERETTVVAGPFFRARLMERGAAREGRRRQSSTDARVARGYELLASPTDENGELVVLTASCEVETDCPVLGSPTIQLDAQPELLTNGTERIGWAATGVKVGDAA